MRVVDPSGFTRNLHSRRGAKDDREGAVPPGSKLLEVSLLNINKVSWLEEWLPIFLVCDLRLPVC